MSWHLAETREQARPQARLLVSPAGTTSTSSARLQRAGAEHYDDPDEALERITERHRDLGDDDLGGGRHS